MNLNGVTAYGVPLAESLAALLLKHGYITEKPGDHIELLEVARTAAPTGYLTGYWSHIFGGAGGEKTVRFVFSRSEHRIIAMQVPACGGQYVEASAAAIADVQDSLLNANPEALAAPADFDLSETHELPDWAPKDLLLKEKLDKVVDGAANFYSSLISTLLPKVAVVDDELWRVYKDRVVACYQSSSSDRSKETGAFIESLSARRLLGAAMHLDGPRKVAADLVALTAAGSAPIIDESAEVSDPPRM